MSSPFLDRLETLPGQVRPLKPGMSLFAQGDAVSHVFAVIQGEIRLLRFGQDGHPAVLQRAGPGALVAEASILSACYHCAAEAVAETRLRVWPRAAVQALLKADPEAALAFATHLASEVRAARQRAEILSFRRLSDRLDAWRIWHDGEVPPRGKRHLLARELGVSPEALYRELARRGLG